MVNTSNLLHPLASPIFRATVVLKEGLGRMSFSGWALLRQSPRVAVLLQSIHDIIGNSIPLFFGQFLAKSAHEFPRAP
jgi:hypothetical protein